MREGVLQLRRRVSVGLALFSMWGQAATARADDWLALLPACGLPAGSSPALEVIYPEASLPAVVAAADGLVARVRVPAALTPPPGVQQERALRGWSAELIGGDIALGATPLSHRHTLAIVAVRPDAGSSLVYRIRMLVPAYVAPGRYSLWLRTPFGERRVERAIFVTSRAAAWPGWPPLEIKGRSLALRVGSELWVSDACAAQAASFESDVRSLLAVERRTRVNMAAPPSQLMAAVISDAGELLGWSRTDKTLQADSPAPVERRLRVLLPAASKVEVTGAKLELYPASDLSLHRIAAISAVLTVPAGSRARLAIAQPAARSVELSIEPRVTESGARTRLHVLGAEASARVAYDYGFGRTAWAGPEHWAEFAGPLPQPLRALVLTPARGGELLRQRLHVAARRPPNCSSLGPATRTPQAGWAALAGLAALRWLLRLLKKRRRLGLGIDSAPAVVLSLAPFRMSNTTKIPGPRAKLVAVAFHWRLSCLLLPLLAAACEPTLIPNTRVEDTAENREVIDFIEKYRQAVETRNTPALLALASVDYFDDMGTPSGNDDIDYEGLKAGLTRIRQEVLGARYQISYRSVTYDNNQRVLVDVLYTGWFRVNPLEEGSPEWKRRLEPHRIILAREAGGYRILSGM